MGADLRCPNCRDNLGKETENPKDAWCGTCGKPVRNPRGYREEPASNEVPIGSQTTWTEPATGKTYEIIKRMSDGGFRVQTPKGPVWVDSSTKKLGWFAAPKEPIRPAPVMQAAAKQYKIKREVQKNGQPFYRVIDPDTGTVVATWPSEAEARAWIRRSW